jgi:bifunctional non-homologous end joining protein LigD
VAKKLERYRAMRDKKRTPEPFDAGTATGGGRLFVIQAHQARRMHYDLRLEHRGVLVSWAVPKGIPEATTDKHLAVHVEDHPLPYADFEGFIPKGEYGAGDVIIWDKGSYVPLGDVGEGLESGKIVFELHGQRARGLFTLVRTGRKNAPSNQWLLMKKDPEWKPKAADKDVRPAHAIASELQARGVPKRALSAKDAPLMLAEIAERAFSSPDFVFELKYDGYRLLAEKAAPDVRLYYRQGKEVAARYPEIAAAVSALSVEHVILDGELVALDDKGIPRFSLLQDRTQLTNPKDVERGVRAQPLVLMAFDLLALDGYDLRALPLLDRKAYLKRLLVHAPPALRFADHVQEDGEALLERVKALGLEGVMAKRRDGPYRSGRSRDWLKLRLQQTKDLAVIGYGRPEKIARMGFSSLLLAERDGAGWRYLGRVGSGFDHQTLSAIRAELDRAIVKTPPASVPKEEAKDVVWTEPRLVVEVRYTEISRDGRLRQPVFLRVRDDKTLDDEAAADAPEEQPKQQFTVSNPNKAFFPGLSKADLVDYYRAVAAYALPYYRDRPAVLTRFPDGYAGKSFFQKDAPDFAPAWLRRERMYSESTQRDIDHFVLDSAEAFAYVANLGTIPIHVWSSRIGSLEHPDYTVIDLDPKSAPFADVVTIARALKDLCDAIAMPSFVKTTGSSGLHVLLPLGRACTYAQSKTIALLVAGRVAERLPQIATLQRDPQKRDGKVYLDCFQNGHGKTIAGPYCVRPHEPAPVSMPLEWSQVTKKLGPRDYTVKNALAYLKKRKRDPHEGLLTLAPDLVAVLDRLQQHV